MGISCSMYDQLELAAMRQSKIRLNFKIQDGEYSVIEGQISNLHAKNGDEFIVMKDGLTYALNHLIALEEIN